jgi:hypothetical protein
MRNSILLGSKPQPLKPKDSLHILLGRIICCNKGSKGGSFVCPLHKLQYPDRQHTLGSIPDQPGNDEIAPPLILASKMLLLAVKFDPQAQTKHLSGGLNEEADRLWRILPLADYYISKGVFKHLCCWARRN